MVLWSAIRGPRALPTALAADQTRGMTIAARSGPSPADMLAVPRIPIIGRRVVAALFLWSGGIHVGLLSADPEIYRRFADRALFPFVRDGWAEVFMAQPRAWALALAFAETVTGILLLTRGRAVAAGWVGVIVFHVLLLLFGF